MRSMKIVTIVAAAIAVAAVAALVYFYTQGDDIRLGLKEAEQAEQLMTAQIQQLQQERNLLEADLHTTKEELNELTAFHEKMLQEVKTANHHLITELEGEIERNQIKITQLGDSLQVRVLGSILFPSGELELTEEGLAVVQKIGRILKSVKDKGIRVEGHTDNVPVSAGYRKFSNNWELSAMRAINVVRFLIDVTGLDPAQFEAVGMSEYHPIADNDTEQGRSLNRRIEIMLIPLKRVEIDDPLQVAAVEEVSDAEDSQTPKEEDAAAVHE